MTRTCTSHCQNGWTLYRQTASVQRHVAFRLPSYAQDLLPDIGSSLKLWAGIGGAFLAAAALSPVSPGRLDGIVPC